MKIRSEEFYFASTASSTILHLSNHETASRSVCGGIANIDIVFPYYNEADKSKVCKNCLKHTDAWEPVAEHQPLYVDRKLLENAEAELIHSDNVRIKAEGQCHKLERQLDQKTKDFAEACKNLDERYLKMKEERDGLKHGHDMDKNCLKDRVKVRDKRIDSLTKERDEMQSKAEAWGISYRTLEEKYFTVKAATAGHTPENIATIMKAAPPAESFEGHKVEWRSPVEGEQWWSTRRTEWREADACILRLHFVRVPIVEWIENPTDEMVVKAGGRVPCEVRDHSTTKWRNETLLMVRENNKCRFICAGDNFKSCRIKKSDLEQS